MLNLMFKKEIGKELESIVKSILLNMMEGNDSDVQFEEVSNERRGYDVLFKYLEENKVLEVEEVDCWWNLKFGIWVDKIILEYEDVSYKYEVK